jgi:hypothetical protein
MDFAADIYATTNRFPRANDMAWLPNYAGQLFRSPATSPKVKAASRKASLNSSWEMREDLFWSWKTQLLIAKKLDYIHVEQCTKLLLQSAELGRILNGLINALWR